MLKMCDKVLNMTANKRMLMLNNVQRLETKGCYFDVCKLFVMVTELDVKFLHIFLSLFRHSELTDTTLILSNKTHSHFLLSFCCCFIICTCSKKVPAEPEAECQHCRGKRPRTAVLICCSVSTDTPYSVNP